MADDLIAADLAVMADFARELADAARRETLPLWSAGCAADNKTPGADFDPVTEADRGAERAMRALIEARFPDHGIFGEEFPDRQPKDRYSWSLDPIDGTRSFICRLPTWTTLIALLRDGLPVLGLIDAPCLDERYLGYGPGTMQSGSRNSALETSGCTRIEEARLSTTDPYMLGEGWERLRRQARTTRYGHDGYGYARLAAGSIDLIVETALKPHDYNALIPVVRSAGGIIGDWSGGEDFSSGSIIAAATPELFDAAVGAMR
jgi:myo-inositol-1(or 4)-monophosphatase